MKALTVKIDSKSHEECIKCLEYILSELKNGNRSPSGYWNDYVEGKKTSFYKAELLDDTCF